MLRRDKNVTSEQEPFEFAILGFTDLLIVTMLYSLYPKFSRLAEHSTSGHTIGKNLVSKVDEFHLIHEKSGEAKAISVESIRNLIEEDDKLVEVYMSTHKSMYKKQASNLVIQNVVVIALFCGASA